MAKKKKKKKKKVVKKQQAGRRTVVALPTERKEPDTDLTNYIILIYGREKIGKTVTFASFPETLFLSTEPGAKGLRIFEYNNEDGGCKDWQTLRDAVKLLEDNPDKFKHVVIDTADRAYEMCMDYTCKKMGIEYPGVDSSGVNDYGKSWNAIKREFLGVIHRIIQSGRGLGFTSHVRESEVKTRSGDKFTRIIPSMSGQARSVVEALVDFFLYAEYMKDVSGKTVRVLITEGDEVVFAGHREIEGLPPLPRFLPILKKGGYDLIQAAFSGQDVGLDPTTLMPSRQTTETGKAFLGKAQSAARKKKKKKKKKKV